MCLSVHTFVFLPADNSQRAYKMCKGVKTVSIIPALHTQINNYCKKTEVSKPVPNFNGHHSSYDKRNQVCLSILFFLRAASCAMTSYFCVRLMSLVHIAFMFQSNCTRVCLKADLPFPGVFAGHHVSNDSVHTCLMDKQ